MEGFTVNLKEFQLGDVLQFLGRVKKSGVLKITGDTNGEIYLKDGLVVHAVDGTEKGMDALMNLSFTNLEIGSFEIGVACPNQTISEDLGKLTETIEKRRIEFEEVKKKMPPIDTILAKSTRDLESAVALRRTDWQILALIDGKRKLGDVITESKLGGFEATKTITWLMEQGLICEPAEAQRVMAELTKFLGIVFEDFGRNGLSWLKQWAGLDPNNKKIIDALNINEETFEIETVAEINSDKIRDALKSFTEFINSEGKKVYGKVLFKKKFQSFKQKV